MEKPSFFKRVTNTLLKTRSKQKLSSVEEKLGLPPLDVSLTDVRTYLNVCSNQSATNIPSSHLDRRFQPLISKMQIFSGAIAEKNQKMQARRLRIWTNVPLVRIR